MKNKILILLTIFLGLSNTSNAQEVIKTLGSLPGAIDSPESTLYYYYKDTNNLLDKFTGTWLYDDGIHYFKISFSKKEHVKSNAGKNYIDELVCEYLYKENNITIYNTYGINSNINDYLANHISGSNVIGNKVKLRYNEPPITSCARYKSGQLTLNYIANTIPELIWAREYDKVFGVNNICDDGSIKDMSDFLIPENMTLIKQ